MSATNDGAPPQAPAGKERLGSTRLRLAAIVGGLLLFAVLLALPAPPGMSEAAWRVTATASLMAIWWIFEAVPVAVTALLPICLFPFLGVAPIREATAPYANPLIYLFMGGFMIALAVERWNLHRRIALNIVRLFGVQPSRLIGGFMLATAALSMWVSNTATTVMMLPVALSVIGLLAGEDDDAAHDKDRRNFAIALLLGIAYAASVGGLGTLVGTPPNALLAGYMAEVHGIEIGFGQWMLVGVPLVVVLLPLVWLILTRLVFAFDDAHIAGTRSLLGEEIAKLGPISTPEIRVALVFAATAAAWILRPTIGDLFPQMHISDAGIALVGAVSLFLIPADLRHGTFLMNWDWARRLPWGILILFGGGLSLASAISGSGLAEWIGQSLSSTQGWSGLAILVLVITTVIFLTEITSNTATAAVFLPIVGAVAVTFGSDAFTFAAPAAIAASCAFMMPVATPPNAIVFGSGRLTIPDMARAGLPLNLVAILVITAMAYTGLAWVFG